MSCTGSIRFGVFELNLESGEIRKRGLKLRIGEQPFAVLAALTERPGELVTRDELQVRLWPAGIHVDSERGLNGAVYRLREILSDQAAVPRFIECIPRRGYRWLAPVEVLPTPDSAPTEQLQAIAVKPAEAQPVAGASPNITSSATRRWPKLALAAAFGLVIASVAAKVFLGNSRSPDFERLPPARPLTSLLGREFGASLSPDGSRLAYVWTGDRKEAPNADIYIRDVDGERATRLTSDSDDEYSPVWSPDGRYIAFLQSTRQRRAIIVIESLEGGEQHSIGAIAEPPGRDRQLAWTANSTHLIAPDLVPGTQWFGLYSYAVKDGTSAGLPRVQLTSPPPGGEGDLNPGISPDGRHLAFTRTTGTFSNDLFLAALHTNAPLSNQRRITFANRRVDSPAWTPDGRGIFYSSAESLLGSRSLWYVGAFPPARPRALTDSGVSQPALPNRGTRLVFTHEDIRDSTIWTYRLGASPSSGSPKPIFASTGLSQNADLSPDGKTVAFRSYRSGDPEIWLSDVDGGNLRRITSFGAHGAGAPRWSPDGRSIAVDSSGDAYNDVFIIDVETRSAKKMTFHPGNDRTPSWSRDGKFLYFGSDRTGSYQVWKIPSCGGEPVRITQDGGVYAIEAPDGRSLYYSDNFQTPKLLLVPLSGGKPRVVAGNLANVGAFALGNDGVYYLSQGRDHIQMLPYAATDKPRTFAVLSEPATPILTISRDGSQLVYTTARLGQSDLQMVDNYR